MKFVAPVWKLQQHYGKTGSGLYVYIKYKAIPINHIYLHMHYYVVQLVDIIAVETK